VSAQPDLIDHDGRHRDGVTARPRSLSRQLRTPFGYLVEPEAEQPTTLIDAGQQQLPDGRLNGRFVTVPAGHGVAIVESGIGLTSGVQAPGCRKHRRGHFMC
jgi:hypothetical protein